MDLVDALREANQLVHRAELPEALHPAAFTKVLDILLDRVPGPGLADRPPRVEPPASLLSAASTPVTENDEATIMERISDKLQIPVELVREAYFLSDGSLGLALPSGALSRVKSEGARQIAILIAAARQAAELEPDGWTPSSEIREVCDQYGKFDVGNFGKTLRAMGDVFQIKGNGPSRAVRARQLAYERAAALIRGRLGTP